jgi:hypothetical protein
MVSDMTGCYGRILSELGAREVIFDGEKGVSSGSVCSISTGTAALIRRPLRMKGWPYDNAAAKSTFRRIKGGVRFL